MSESTAKILLKLEGVEEVLNQLKNVSGALAGVAGSVQGGLPATGGMVASPGGGAVIAQPPTPTTHPTALSAAATVAGSPAVGASLAQVPAVAAQGEGGEPEYGLEAFGLLAGLQIANTSRLALSMISRTAISRAEAAFSGGLYHPELQRAAGAEAGFGIGGAFIGGAIGSIIPGVGTLVGAGIGGFIGEQAGAVAGDRLKAEADFIIANQRVAAVTGGAYGFLPTETANYVKQAALAGRALSPGMVRQLEGRYVEGSYQQGWTAGEWVRNALFPGMIPFSGPAFGADPRWEGGMLEGLDDDEKRAAMGVIARGRFSRAGMRAFGIRRESYGTGTQARDAIVRSIFMGTETPQDAAEAGAILEMMQLPHQADLMFKSGEQQLTLETNAQLGAAKLGVASAKLQLAARYGGSSAVAAASGVAGEQMDELAQNYRSQAAVMRARGRNSEAKLLDVQAEMMTIQKQAMGGLYYDSRFEEVSAFGGLGMGRADRAFQTSLYGGGRSDSLPWSQRSGAANKYADEMESAMQEAKAAGYLSPAREAQMRNQVEQLRFQANVETRRDRELMRNAEMMGETAFGGARAQAGIAHETFFGSASDRTKQYDEQAKLLDAQERTIRKILETSTMLTYQEKLTYQTQLETLKVEQERVKAQGVIARAGATRGGTETVAAEASLAPTEALIRGAGGAEAGAAQAGVFASLSQRKGAVQTYISDLIAGGFSPDSPEVREARQQLVGLQVAETQAFQSLATVPMGGAMRAAASNLNTQGQFISAGFGGGWGDARANLQARIGLAGERVHQLEENKASVIRRFGQGAWSAEMEARYTEERNAAALEMMNLGIQYEEGWDQRIISQAYNMPAHGRLYRARFTQAEAALSGVYHRSFGGTEEQTRHMREAFPRMMRMLGAGSSGGFAERAMSESEKGMNININLTLDDGSGKGLQKTSHQVNKDKTSRDANFNVHMNNRPKG